jgi:hypothetical protein
MKSKLTIFAITLFMASSSATFGGTMDRIDHKDQPGEYRASVFQEVQLKLKFKGEQPKDRNIFLGDWVCRFGDSEPKSFQSFTPDGNTSSKAVDGTWESKKDRWELNTDLSFSLWAYTEPMPEYGINEPTYSEERYHVLIKSKNEFVLFSGDGSSILVYSKANPK